MYNEFIQEIIHCILFSTWNDIRKMHKIKFVFLGKPFFYFNLQFFEFLSWHLKIQNFLPVHPSLLESPAPFAELAISGEW